MSAFLHQILSGLASGSIYASIALALVMIYQATHHINFAQGEMATLSTYLALVFLGAGFSYWAAFAAALVLSFALGLLIERLLVRPLAQAPVLSQVGLFIGLLLIINSVMGWLFGFSVKAFPSPFPPVIPWLGGWIAPHEAGAMGVTLIVLLLVWAFFRFTPLGLAMRAAALNPQSARLVGIDVGLMLSLGWGLAAAIGAVAGIMIAPIVFLDPNMMAGILLYAFAGALLGGIDNPWGAVAGGLLVGVIEDIAGAYLVGPELKLTLALVLIIAILLVRPAGLFGRRVMSRV
jgi:branched-chain amino acid transport system permease protein